MQSVRTKSLACVLFFAATAALSAEPKTRNVILITFDGARTQEIFGGLDLSVLKSASKEKKVEESEVYKRFWAPTPNERRQKLLPFFWGTLMSQYGSIGGNRALGSTVQITNTHRFSYPGYSEILTGEAHDDLISSNDRKPNPNLTVLELVKRKLSLDHQQVAAFCSWNVLDAIVMHEPDAFTSNGGFEDYDHPDSAVRMLSRLQHETETPWDDVRHDAYTFRLALAHLKTYKPRALYIGFGQPDDWSHDAKYNRVLESFARIDGFLKELWEQVQSDDAYRDKTTILLATDHGRGNTTSDWTDHGAKVEGAQYIWLACVSPDCGLRGEWVNAETVYQNQIAATIARFLGLDYAEQNPRAGKPIARLFE